MTNCLQCNKPLTHVEGRKQKSFCDVNCRNKYFYAQRKELVEKAKVMVGEETEIAGYAIDETKNKVVSFSSNGITPATKEQINPEIEKMEQEFKTLGDTPLAKQRKKFLTKKIYELKQQLK
jgi:hypothetical protein